MKKFLQTLTFLALMVVPWVTQAQQTLTVADDTLSNEYVPFYGYYADADQHNQVLYPATELSAMVGQSISQMVFYIDPTASNGGNTAASRLGTWTVSLGVTTATQLSALDATTTLSQVYEGYFDCSSGTLTIVFDDPYLYTGGNLLLDIDHEAANWNRWYFLGTYLSGASYCYGSQQNFLPKTTFSYQTPSTCSRPTGLNVTLTPGNGTVASLSWTENGTASAWQVCLNNDETNLIDVTSPLCSLTNLSPETTYYAKVRSVCGTNDVSNWSNEISFTPTNAYTVTVNDGTTTNAYVPIYGYWADNITKSQFIIPASSLASMQYGTVNKLTFYSSNASVSWGNATFEVYMTETNETTLSALADYSSMDLVKSAGTLSISGNVMEVTLTTPFQYMGGNLMVGFLQTVSGSYATSNWYGVTASSGASWGGYGTSISAQSFLPKVTFDYIPGQAPSCPKPTGLTVTYNGGTSAVVSWNSDASAFNVEVNGTVSSVTQNPYTLTGLSLATAYSVKVQAVCATGSSDWTNPVSFNTDLCDTSNQCAITLVLTDSYGDGWNGGQMAVVDSMTNSTLGTFTLDDGDLSTETINVCNGRTIQLVFTAGNYSTENGWAVVDVNGDTVIQREGCNSGCTPNTGIVASYDVNCTVSTCRKPSNVVASNIDNHNATLSWVENGTATAWQICINGDATNITNATTNPFQLTGLDAETSYSVMIRSNCGNEFSNWTNPVTFTTDVACPNPTNLDVVAGSNSASVNWLGNANAYTLQYGAYSAVPNPTGASYLLYYDNDTVTTSIGNSTSADWTWGVLYPSTMLQTGGVINKVSVFELSNYWTSDYSVSIYSGSTTEPTTLLTTQTVTPMDSDGFHEIILANPVAVDPSQNIWVVVNASGTYVLTACVTTESNNQWVYSGGSWYHIADLASSLSDYGWMIRAEMIPVDYSSVNWTTVNNTTAPATINGLAAQTDYLVRVKALCGGQDGESGWTMTAFTTTVSAGDSLTDDVALLPYYCSFDGNDNGYWNLVNGDQVNHWMIGDNMIGDTTHTALYITNDSITYAYTVGSGSYVFATRRMYIPQAGSYTYSFDWIANGESSYDFIRAAIVPDSTVFEAGSYCGFNNSTGVPAGGYAIDGGRLNLSSAWQTTEGEMIVATPGVYKLVFLWRNDNSGGSQPPAAIDNIMFMPTSCPMVQNVSAVPTDNSIALTWTAGGSETMWEVTCAETTYTANTNSYTFAGLMPNTDYNISIRALCSADESSSLYSTTIHTPCVAVQVPYSENFDTLTTSTTAATGVYVDCWPFTMTGTATYQAATYQPKVYYSATYANSGSYSLRLYGVSYTCLPPMAEPLAGLQLTFNAYVTSTSNKLAVGVMEGNNFIPVDTVNLSTSTHNPVTVFFGNYTGNSRIIAFRNFNTSATSYTSTIYIDDVAVDFLPSCVEVSNLTVSAATSNSLTLSWVDDMNSSATYTIYGSTGAVIATNVTGTTYTVTGLEANTQYTYAVVANCSSTDVSSSVTVTGQTLCNSETLPWSEDFSATLASDPCWRGASNATAAEVFAGATLNLSANNAWTYASSASNGLDAGHYRVNIYGSSCKKWMVTPTIDLTNATSAQLSFDAAFTVYTTGSNAPASGFENNNSQAFMVLVSTDGGATWPEANAVKWQNQGGQHTLAELASSTYITQVVNLNQYLGQTIRIAFYAQSTTSGGDNNLHIDNILVGEASNCASVTALAATDVTPNSVTLSWTDAENSGATYSVYNMNDTVLLASGLTTTSYTATGLAPHTSYMFRVVANCSATEASLPASINVVTLNEPIMCGNDEATTVANNDSITGTTNYFPGYSLYNYSYSEVIVPAAQLQNLTEIKGMEFYVNTTTAGSSHFDNCQVYLMNTAATSLGDGFIQAVDNMQLVYTGSLSQTETGWNLITFNNSFVWNGTDNILVAVLRGDGTWAASPSFGSYSATDTLGRYVYNDNAAYTIGSITGGTPVTNVPVYRFIGCEGVVEPGDTVNITIAVNDATMGTTVPAPGTHQYTSGSTFTVTAYPNTGYHLADWQMSIYIEGYGNYTAQLGNNNPTISEVIDNTYDGVTLTAIFAADSSATSCPDSVAIPYTEGFENGADCWDVYATSSSTGLISSGAYEGSNAFVFSYSTLPPQYLISPRLAGTGSSLQMEFYYKVQSTSYPESFQVGYSTTTNDTNAFVWSNELTNLTNLTYEHFVQVFNASGIKYVAVKYTANDMYRLYVDNVVVRDVPTCLPVTNLTAASATTTSITLSWTDTDNTGATYSIYTVDATGATLVASGITGNSYTVSGLTAATSYIFGVVANCSATDVGDMVTVSANTECSGAAINLPFTEDFGAASGTRNCWTLVDGDGDGYGWSTMYNGQDVEIMLSASYDNPTYTALTPNNWLISPKLHTVSGTNITLEWSVGAADASYAAEHYGVYVSTTNTDTGSFTLLNEWTLTSDDLINMNLDLSSYAGQDIYVAFRHFNCTDQFMLMLDDVYVHEGTVHHDTVSVTVAVNDATMGTTTPAPGTYQYLDNDTLYLTATPFAGYHFEEWQVAYYNNGTQATTSFDDADIAFLCSGLVTNTPLTFTAVFAADTLAIDCPGNTCYVTVEGEDSYGDGWNGSELYLMQHDTIVGVFTLESGSARTSNFMVCSDYPVNFVWSAGNYTDEASFTVSNNYGQLFSIPDGSMLNDTVIARVTNVCSSNPTVDLFVELDSLTITLAVNDATMGTTTPAPGTYQIDEMSTMTVVATPNPGYYFHGWAYSAIEDGTIISDTAYGVSIDTLEIDAADWMDYNPVTFTALFSSEPYVGDSMLVTISVNDPTMGTTSPAPGNHYFHEGDTCSVIAVPYSGYAIEGWYIQAIEDGETVIDQYVPYPVDDVFDLFQEPIVVSAGWSAVTFNVTAHFTADTTSIPDEYLTLITSVNNPVMGTMTPEPGVHHYVEGDEVFFTVTPNAGYHYESADISVTYMGITYDTTVTTDISNPDFSLSVDEDMLGAVVMVNVNFAPDSGTTAYLKLVTAVNDPNMGIMTPAPGEHYYVVGDVVEFSATPYDGYHYASADVSIYFMGMLFFDTTVTDPLTELELEVEQDMLGAEIHVTVNFARDNAIDVAGALADVKVYPNPTHGVVNIDADGVVKVEVLDLNGRKVATFGEGNRLDISNLSAGTYILRIETTSGVAVKRVVKK